MKKTENQKLIFWRYLYIFLFKGSIYVFWEYLEF